MKMPEYGIDTGALDRSESKTARSEDRPLEKRSESAKRAIKSAEQKLCWFTRQKNPVARYRYNDYMAHRYAYMAKVAEVRELESYAKATKEENWCAAMEEEMHTLVKNETWDLVDTLKGIKPIGCRWVYKVKYCHEDLHFGL